MAPLVTAPTDYDARVIVTVSTVKDRLPNVQRFVEGNLAGGADHMLVFLDAPEPEVEAWLAERPEVTTVLTDDTWWRGARPALLNRRQSVNANLARTVLARWGDADWLFHIDADEILQVDREALAAVGRKKPAVNVQPLEVVGALDPAREPRQFKRLLSDGELHLVHALGLLAEPTNSRYFRSHIAGKVGVRPGSDTWLGIHKATNAQGERLKLVRRPGLRMLHIESYSGAEFVRKWTNMVSSGPSMHFGEHRMGLAKALRTLVSMEIPEDVKSRHLSDFYQRHMADPIDELDSLGLLMTIDPRGGGHVPAPLATRRLAALRQELEAMRGQDKEQFVPPRAPGAAPESPAASTPSTTPPKPTRKGLLGRLRE